MSPEGVHKRSRAVLIVVFTTILIDFIGFSVLIPVLPLFADRLGATPLQIGLILLPLWGWASDRMGRRPVLLFSLLGTAASFVLLAGAETIALVYVARILAGFFAASIGTAQAVVTDVTPPSERAGGMGVIGAAFGIGMVVGPMLGGGLARFHEQPLSLTSPSFDVLRKTKSKLVLSGSPAFRSPTCWVGWKTN